MAAEAANDKTWSGGRARWLVPALLLALAAVLLLSLGVGPARLSVARLVAALQQGGDPAARLILFELRAPRTLLGALVGAILGLSGAALQGYLRNPLADPGVLGTSNMAAAGAVLAFYSGLAAAHPLLLPALAVAGAIGGLLLLLPLAGGERAPEAALVLAGIALSTLAGAAISLGLALAPNPFAAMDLLNWLMGSLENRSWLHVWLALPPIVLAAAALLSCGPMLDALVLGADGARSLGFDLTAGGRRLIAAVALGVGGAVAVSGAIGFVGLIVPHLLRPWTDRSPSALLLPSLLGGAVLLVLADVAVRLIPALVELRLGIVTALAGVPVFVAQLKRVRGQW
jgi:iron complex transport system permease protein